MKFILVCLFAIGTVVYVYGRPEDRYTDRFDNIDVDQILHNDRLLKRYADCLLEKSDVRCPPEANELKNVLSEALETECAKCSDHQKEVAKKAIKFLVNNKRDMWNELKAKYDPEGKFTKKYEDLAAKEGVTL
ncbi:allergen Tha p 1-like [Cataglyphis hispanica]|uniref:allergen Tha p 1-like n=1 Tax=Cataglyphis hispanica TaxID=1086592 RepID=UPI00217F5084|nr:allergen Tha p 1-like [Cataglyphis hispanica]XP_050463672.1 allergen Tha p 1-like [Cataglyphis hispanica]